MLSRDIWPGGGKIPFGYDYDADKGILVPNSDAETVREIYARYLEGQSTGRIARELGLKYEHLVRQISAAGEQHRRDSLSWASTYSRGGTSRLLTKRRLNAFGSAGCSAWISRVPPHPVNC